MSLQIIAADRIAPRPWANHGGSTRELFVWPDPATQPGDWQVRISLADVTRDGPFSPYPGIERWFAVVDGAGVVLTLPDGAHLLDPRSDPVQFDGALQPHCNLQHRDTRDLNLMVRRDAGHGTMRRVRGDDEWISAAPLRAVFAAEPMTLQIDDADAAVLPPLTLAVSTHAARQRWRVRSASDLPAAWWLSFEGRPA